ncbi:MAG: exodeoxyribonuclease VII large subunit [Deltaproteobacteria bacterium]|nr:exodeoxyribonuclease VII large subunit [Deltaproteobacteria bacterium]
MTISRTRPSGPPDPARVFRLAELLHEVRGLLEGTYRSIRVEGEVAGLKIHHTSGHRYFELREPGAVLPCVMWRGTAEATKAPLAEGKRVRCRGTLTLWEGGGRFQMIVQFVEQAGAGDIAARLEELKRKLQAEGLTAPERKRPLPEFPRRVGVVTSTTGAALHDVLKVLARRVPLPVVVSPCAVQGEGAAASIVAALERVGRAGGVDVVIVTRGGGSAQDLMAFNEEVVARAVVACPVPVITAVGHEVDVTVVDLVSDLRAATPSEAAERVAPTRAAVAERFGWAVERSRRALRARLVGEARALERLSARLPRSEGLVGPPRQALDQALERARQGVLGRLDRRRRLLDESHRRLSAAHPRWRLARVRGRLTTLQARLSAWRERALGAAFAHLDLVEQALRSRGASWSAPHRERLGAASARLHALSPLGVLGRGYALARTSDGLVLSDAASVHPGDRVDVTLARGELECEVRNVRIKDR